MIVVMVMVMMVIILRFLSRLQVFEGFVWGMDEEGNSGMKRNLLEKGKGERERKKSTRHETRQMRNRRVYATEKESPPILSILDIKAFLQTQKREAKTPALYIGAVERGRERERERSRRKGAI